jgi:hypothetical protein
MPALKAMWLNAPCQVSLRIPIKCRHVAHVPFGTEALGGPLLIAEPVEHVGRAAAFGRDQCENLTAVHGPDPSACSAASAGRRGQLASAAGRAAVAQRMAGTAASPAGRMRAASAAGARRGRRSGQCAQAGNSATAAAASSPYGGRTMTGSGG